MVCQTPRTPSAEGDHDREEGDLDPAQEPGPSRRPRREPRAPCDAIPTHRTIIVRAPVRETGAGAQASAWRPARREADQDSRRRRRPPPGPRSTRGRGRPGRRGDREQRRERHHRRDAAREQARGRGGRDQHRDHEQVPEPLDGDEDRGGEQREQREVDEQRLPPSGARAAAVEADHEQLAVQQRASATSTHGGERRAGSEVGVARRRARRRTGGRSGPGGDAGESASSAPSPNRP